MEEERILAFIDLLGFSRMVSIDQNKARQILNDFYNISWRLIRSNEDVKGTLMSDSLLLYSSNRTSILNCLSDIYRECFKKNKEYESLGKDFFLLLRGAVSEGFVRLEDRTTSPNLDKNFIVSPALVHSAKLESLVKGSRLLVAVKEDSQEQNREYNWNNNLKSLLYPASSIKYMKGYKYTDVLWFRDESKVLELQRAEVEEMLVIAFELVKDNATNPKVIEQHIQTLRIGLLSYIKFLDREDDPILKELLENYTASQYWLLWITMIEMITGGFESWRFEGSKEIVSFYTKASLEKGWIEVINEINKEEQKYLKGTFKAFMKMLDVR
ncbi:hypothetical protein AB9K26_02385 [Psychroserpens sp. XS_ASV72]|uniref:hypothetical protein n=1 Tax=Psychroserpens sp. XS_ASV72 TaxID=3241293 RepID=UPI003515ACED